MRGPGQEHKNAYADRAWSTYCETYVLRFPRDVDWLIRIASDGNP